MKVGGLSGRRVGKREIIAPRSDFCPGTVYYAESILIRRGTCCRRWIAFQPNILVNDGEVLVEAAVLALLVHTGTGVGSVFLKNAPVLA